MRSERDMQHKPWTIKEGFLAGGGLIVAGLLMQWSIGPTVWDVFAWPVNGIALAVFVAMIAERPSPRCAMPWR